MNKNILFVSAIVLISFASCKKDRTCTCTYSHTGNTASTTIVETQSHLTKKTGKRVLDCYSYVTTDNYGTTWSKTCEIK